MLLPYYAVRIFAGRKEYPFKLFFVIIPRKFDVCQQKKRSGPFCLFYFFAGFMIHPMTRLARTICAFAILLAATPAPVLACKYSVRDVGFVDLEPTPYRLVLAFDDTTAAAVKDLERRGREVLADSNVAFTPINLSREPAHPLLARLGTIDRQALPLLWLMDGGRRTVPLILPRTKDGAVDGERFQSELAAAIDSPVRRALREHVADGLCVILLLEGSDPSSTRRARKAAEQVVEQINQALPRLEKPTKQGALLVTVRAEDRDKERWTLWGLEEDVSLPVTARAAVVFGRCRRVGKVLQGDKLNGAELFALAATLGRSCECSLDRTWLYGPALPHVWDQQQRQNAAKALTFDPENPLVKAEISAIVAKPPAGEGLRHGSSRTLTFEELMLGYKEQVLDDDGPASKPNDALVPRAPASGEHDGLTPRRAPSAPLARARNPEGEGGFSRRLVLTLVGLVLVSSAAAGWVFLRAWTRKV